MEQLRSFFKRSQAEATQPDPNPEEPLTAIVSADEEQPSPWAQAGLTPEQWFEEKDRASRKLIDRLKATLNWMEHPNDPRNKLPLTPKR